MALLCASAGNGLKSWVPRHIGDALSASMYVFVAAYLLYPHLPDGVYLFFLFVAVFVLPGWYIVKILVNKGLLPSRMDVGLICALVPSLGILTAVLVGSLEYTLRLRLGIAGFAIAIALAQLAAFFTRGSSESPMGLLERFQLLALIAIVAVPICGLILFMYLVQPPSPFPYFVGWDTFTYMMLAGRAYSGVLSFPITNINPITEQLPIPVGFPLFASMLFPPSGPTPSVVVALMKFGALVPSVIGMFWTFSIFRKVTTLFFASVGSVVAYSFVGGNVIDTKWFLPASFAWVFSLAMIYSLLFLPWNRSRLALSLTFGITGLFFHFYTTVATVIVTTLGVMASRAIRADASRPNNLLGRSYPLVGMISVLLINVLGFSFVIPGGGEVSGGLSLLSQKMLLLARTMTPAAWIIGISVSAYSIGRPAGKWKWKHPANFLVISLLLYLLPISASFRLLVWPAIFGVLVTIKVVEIVSAKLAQGVQGHRPRLARAIPILFAVSILASATYPSLVPPGIAPVYYITEPSGQIVQSNYSLSEYSSAVYLGDSPPAKSYLIVSDPGFSLMLGGLTGQEALRVTDLANMKPFQDLFRVAVSEGFNGTTAIELENLLAQRFDLDRYDGIVLAFSARTYYWTKYYGVITWAPVDLSYFDSQARSILEQSSILSHIYSGQDVDLFYLPLP